MTRHSGNPLRGGKNIREHCPERAEIIIKNRGRVNSADAVQSQLNEPEHNRLLLLSCTAERQVGVPINLFARDAMLAVMAAFFAAGCIYPPTTQPPPDAHQQVVIALPYDLAWDAVNNVIKQNSLRVQAVDSNAGIIETVGPRFTLHDADCGRIKSVVGTYPAEPEMNASTVYTFGVHPRGPEASIVQVLATFNSPVKVPLHPATDVDCVSHGIQEGNLLQQVLAQAKQTHRPVFSKPIESNAAASAPTNHAASRSSIERGNESAKESNPAPPPTPQFSLGGIRPRLEHSNLPDLPTAPMH